ncbi:MAG: molybdopterin-guanine dinucleotide biosynthesis protein A [Candidatus Azotimanducaceae bacterium]|jgi:molybdopterin-guanine dinucleotide biosynthesis protein A
MKERVSAIILAGGQGSRMNFQNKGLQIFKGQPLIQHVVDRISDQVDDIVISANDKLDEYRSLGFPVVADQEESLGPLSGITSSLNFVKHSLVLVTPCDTPFLPNDLVPLLERQLVKGAISVFANERIQPLISLIRLEAKDSIEEYLQGGKRSVMGWLEQVDADVLAWNPKENRSFRNINSMQDLAFAERDLE